MKTTVQFPDTLTVRYIEHSFFNNKNVNVYLSVYFCCKLFLAMCWIVSLGKKHQRQYSFSMCLPNKELTKDNVSSFQPNFPYGTEVDRVDMRSLVMTVILLCLIVLLIKVGNHSLADTSHSFSSCLETIIRYWQCT